MKTITATQKGIVINYQNSKSSFIPYVQSAYDNTQNQRVNKQVFFEMNEIQRSMYKRLMYGVNAFTSEEISTMTKELLFTISNEHVRASDIINKLKYERNYGAYKKLLAVIFPTVKLDYYKDGKFADMPTLKELKISTIDIINEWINHKLLPLDFYSLNINTLQL